MYYNKAFLKFRFRQFGKIVRDIPVPYLVILTGMAVFLLCGIYAFMDNLTGAAMAGGCFLLLIWLLHLRRNDFHFIQLVEEKPQQVFFMDYWLLSVPVFILEIIRGYYWVGLGVWIGCWLISLQEQPVRRVQKGFSPPRFIPEKAFEYRTGVRKYGWLMLVIYGSAYAGLSLPYVSLVSLWFLTCIMAEFFCYSEPTSILCAQELSANRFLHRKLNLYIRLYFIPMMPVCLLYTLLHPAHWWLAVLFVLLGNLNIALMVVSKYAAYLPNTRITGGQIAISISLFGILFPVLAPLTLLLLIKKYITARRNLIQYLYAYN